MKTAKSVLLLLVCTCLALGLIIFRGQGLQPQTDAEGTAPTGSSTAATNAPTAPSDPLGTYTKASQKLLAKQDLTLTYTYSQSRLVGGETYSESRTGTACYIGRSGATLDALINEDVSYGSYSTHFTESYTAGRAYSQVRGTTFACDMTPEAFLARQIPAVLISSSLYGGTEIGEDLLTYHFSDATALESWADPTGEAQLIQASGTATLDTSGNIVGASYRAEYTLGNIPYTLDVSVSIDTSAEVSITQPEFPENCPVVTDLEIPRHMLRTVDGVYSALATSSEYTETVYFGLRQETLTKTGGYYTVNTGDTFMAALPKQAVWFNSTGSSTTTSQSNIFLDGQYSCSINGSEAYTDPTYTAESVWALCVDSILSAMMVPEHVGSAQLEDDGDFLRIHFQGNADFIQYFSGNLFALFGYETSLDLLADSCSTEAAGGYLVINQYTALPTAMGLELERTHIFDGVSYEMDYRLDQSLALACPNAYEAITGKPQPAEAEESITPLFYRITGENGQQLWLLGTLDVGDARAVNLPAQILEALNSSDAFALEYDPLAFEAAIATDTALQSQLAAAYYYTGSTTADHLSQELYERVYPLMLATGQRNASSNYLKPIIWESQIENLYLCQSYGLSAAFGCGTDLLYRATQADKPVYQIESGLSRLLILTGFSEELQEMLLQRLLDQGIQGYSDRLQQQYELWCRGDEPGLIALREAAAQGMTEEELALYEEYCNAMFTDRTRVMQNAVTGYLESGETVFCAVDVDNLLGEQGLVEALKAAGYTVETVSIE